MKISKHSDTFFDAIQCMKQCVDFPLLLLAISTLYLTVLPLSTLFSVDAKLASGALEGISEIDSIIKFVFFDNISMGFFPIYTLALIVFGVLTAFLAFGFLVNKKKSNVIFSLGLTRARIFANRLRAAAAFLVAAVILPLTITLFANFAIVGVSAEAVKAYFALLTAFLTCEAIGLSVGILSATIMSNLFEGVLSAGSMLAFPSILILFAENVFNSFLEAYPARLKNPEMLFGGGYDNLGLFGRLGAFNPLNLYDTWQSSSQGLLSECGYSVSSEAFILKAPGQLFSNPKSNVPPELFIYSLGWLAVSAIIILFARKCFKKRSMESTNNFGG
ncbi:MAG: hypothetical protein GX851_07880 [Clostridiales bacterium]|nr:hypothetical protein [Clostridiales bacterium]